MAKIEKHVEELSKAVLAQLEDKITKAQTDQERQTWEQQLRNLRENL